jgi:oxygen-independent coproporphyrinogen-3 oxidase
LQIQEPNLQSETLAPHASAGVCNLKSKIPNPQSPIPNPRSPVSRHNLTYWYDEPYVGFGAGAHSYFGGERYWNVLSPIEYVQQVSRDASPVAGREVIPHELEMAETMILGLRLREGVAFKRFAERFGEDARDKYGGQLRQVVELGLAELLEDRVRLTARGRLLSNEVFWRLLPN